MKPVSRQLMLFALIAIVFGCGESTDAFKAARAKTVPASGKITYNGQPLAEAVIVFTPDGGVGVAANAFSNSEGGFVLSAYPGEAGAVPGTYKVTVSKMSPPPDVQTDEASHDAPPSGGPKQKSLIPERYSNPGKSGLEVTIPGDSAGVNNIVLELK